MWTKYKKKKKEKSSKTERQKDKKNYWRTLKCKQKQVVDGSQIQKSDPKESEFSQSLSFFSPFLKQLCPKARKQSLHKEQQLRNQNSKRNPIFLATGIGEKSPCLLEKIEEILERRERKKDSLILSINQQVLSLLWGYTGMERPTPTQQRR